MLTKQTVRLSKKTLLSGAALAGAFLAGAALQPLDSTTAQTRLDRRNEEPQTTFKSGGERSEVVLRDILATLKTMDRRIEQIELAVTKVEK